jgi:hypothetical protein
MTNTTTTTEARWALLRADDGTSTFRIAHPSDREDLLAERIDYADAALKLFGPDWVDDDWQPQVYVAALAECGWRLVDPTGFDPDRLHAGLVEVETVGPVTIDTSRPTVRHLPTPDVLTLLGQVAGIDDDAILSREAVRDASGRERGELLTVAGETWDAIVSSWLASRDWDE